MDLGPDDRFFWFTTTGWMMWNLLVSGLAAGSAIVLFDGSPAQPDLNALWSMAEQLRITWFGVSAPYLQSCFKAGLSPTSTMNLTAIRSIGSTGAPLPPECFRWVYGNVGTDIMLSSMSGGTDICAAMVGGVPLLPVYAGEITCRMLGCAVEAFDDAGCSVHGVVGELVMTKPMPSMPVALWGDPDGSRLEDAYFNTFPGVWKHGDWIRISDRGTCVIEGRSDSTLNRAGVRMGTSEFYRVVEAHPAVEDSLVIDTSTGGVGGQLLLYVVLNEASPLEVVAAQLRSKIRVQLSPRHVPDQIVEIHEVPRTLSGKKCEVPVKRVLGGADLESVVSLDSLSNPRSFEPFVRMPGEGSR
jgi:acetoacetyl-CoA synthetase